MEDHTSDDMRGARLERALARTSDAPLRRGNKLGLLKNGPDTYDDWLDAISGAKRWVHLENYIFASDEVGRRFAEALSKKASENVTVRVLYDWFGCLNVRRSFWDDMRAAGVDVRVVNPLALGTPMGVARRDHRKLLAVDGTYASTGGVCISDGWLVRDPDTNLAYRDTAVRVTGPAVADLEKAFSGTWDEAGRALPDGERVRAENLTGTGEKNVRVVIQEPGKMRMLRILQLLTAGVRRRLWITDAYFLSTPILTQSLMSTARDGVDVRVLVPATNDLPWIGMLSRTGYRQFLESGVRIYEYGGPMIHAKTVVADGWWSKVGSTNLNFSSLSANWEIDLVAEDGRFAAQMERMFEEDLSNAREIRLIGPQSGRRRRPTVEPDRSVRTSDRRARRGVVGSGSGASATVARVSSAALLRPSAPLQTNEQNLAAVASAAVFGASLAALRFPRLVAWPLGAAGAVFGGLGVVRALRSKLTDASPKLASVRRPDPDPDGEG